jgi:hypothetical protein
MQLTRNLYQQILDILWRILAYDCRSAAGVFPDVVPNDAVKGDVTGSWHQRNRGLDKMVSEHGIDSMQS